MEDKRGHVYEKSVLTKVIAMVFVALVLFFPFTYVSNLFFNGSGYGAMTELSLWYMDNLNISDYTATNLDFTNYTGASGYVVFIVMTLVLIFVYRKV